VLLASGREIQCQIRIGSRRVRSCSTTNAPLSHVIDLGDRSGVLVRRSGRVLLKTALGYRNDDEHNQTGAPAR
jgi:hypothetical protein